MTEVKASKDSWGCVPVNTKVGKTSSARLGRRRNERKLCNHERGKYLGRVTNMDEGTARISRRGGRGVVVQATAEMAK